LLVAVSGLVLELQAVDGAGSTTADTVAARFANGLFGVAVLGLMCGVLGLHLSASADRVGCPERER
jgi:hypothetical protein